MSQDLNEYDDLDNLDFSIETPKKFPILCARCYVEVDSMDELFYSDCKEDPEKLSNSGVGMYHCPDCGTMILAGLPHPKVCKSCLERKTKGFDY